MSTDSSIDSQAGQAMLERFEAGELFIPIGCLSWLDLVGADRQKVLGNLTTNNIAALQPGQGCETFITDVRGKTFCHALVYAMPDRLRLVTVGDQFERLAAHIDRYVIREDVQLSDLSTDVYAVFWPGVLGSLFAKRHGLVAPPAPKLCFHDLDIEDAHPTAYQVPWTRDTDWLFAVPRDRAEALEAWFISQDILPGHESLMHCGRIGNRFPLFGVDFDADNLPQELGRDDRAIDFRKGCYLGQETVARLDAMGQVQKKLALWRFDGQRVPTPGMQLRSGDRAVATVTSGTYCFGYGAPLALAMTRRSHFSPGSTADSEIGSATVIEPSGD